MQRPLAFVIMAVVAAACATTSSDARQAPPKAGAPVCSDDPMEKAPPGSGVSITCEGDSSVGFDALERAALARAAGLAVAASRTHIAPGAEKRNLTEAVTECPEMGRDDRRSGRQFYATVTGQTQEERDRKQPCKVISGSEGRVLEVTVRFLGAAEAAATPGARDARQVLGLSARDSDAGAPDGAAGR